MLFAHLGGPRTAPTGFTQMTFQVGEKVVYPNHGVATIENISSRAFAGQLERFYLLRITYNSLTVMVPFSHVAELRLRRVTRNGELARVVSFLSEGRCQRYHDWKDRFRDNTEKMRDGSLLAVAEVPWSAMEGRKALTIKWDEGKWANVSTPALRQEWAVLATKPGLSMKKAGDAAAAFAGAAKKIEAVYEAPYLSHAPMEPLNATVQVRPDGCDIWVASQIQSLAQQTAAMVTGLPAEKCLVHTQYLGGGFGRRGGADYVTEAVEIAKALSPTPVKLTWTREDDLQHDTYRPASYVKFAAGLDAQGTPVSFSAKVVCPPFGGNGTAVEGIQDMHYAIPNVAVDFTAPDTGTPVSYWRSVGYSQNTYFMESFLDEMAAAAGKDPVEFRRGLLAGTPRLLNVLNLAAEKSDWGKPLPAGRFRGVGVVNNIGSFNAQVAEVSVTQGKVKVHRVVCAVDCGQVVNPAIVEAQIQSGIVYGLGTVTKLGITLDKGRVVQKNFNNYDPIRIDEIPVVEVHIVPSRENPGGIGEA